MDPGTHMVCARFYPLEPGVTGIVAAVHKHCRHRRRRPQESELGLELVVVDEPPVRPCV